MTKQDKLNYIFKFAEILDESGDTFFTTGDIDRDYRYIKGILASQGFWSGVSVRYFFDDSLELIKVEDRFANGVFNA